MVKNILVFLTVCMCLSALAGCGTGKETDVRDPADGALKSEDYFEDASQVSSYETEKTSAERETLTDLSNSSSETDNSLTLQEKVDLLLENVQETYRLHWQEKLLAEGKIADSGEVCDVTSYDLEAAITEGATLNVYVTTVTPEYRFAFYQSRISLNDDIEIVGSEDFEFDGIRTREDALMWERISFADWWHPDVEERDQGKLAEYRVRTIGEMRANFAKEQEPSFYQAIQDPVSSLKMFMRLGEGSGEFIRTDTLENGIVIYTFTDGTKIHYTTECVDNVWIPGFFWKDETVEEFVEEHRRIRDALENVTAEELRGVTKKAVPESWNGDGDFVVLSEFPGQDAAFYGLTDKYVDCLGMVLRAGDHVYPVYCPWNSGWTFPEFDARDYDGDGDVEYAFCYLTGWGTEYYVHSLFVADLENGEAAVRTYPAKAWKTELEERVSGRERDGLWTVCVDGEERLTLNDLQTYLANENLTCTGFQWGDIMDFVERDGTWYLDVCAGFTRPDSAIPHYENCFHLVGPVVYSSDGSFRLGEISVEEAGEY